MFAVQVPCVGDGQGETVITFWIALVGRVRLDRVSTAARSNNRVANQ